MMKRIALLALLILCSSLAFAACLDNMIAHYTFDNASDLGNDDYDGYDGSPSGVYSAPGKINNSAGFSPASIAVSGMDFSGDFTVSAWIKASSGGGSVPAIITKVYEGGAYFFFAIYFGKLYVETSGGTMYSTVSVNDNQWHHVVVTRQGNLWKTYIDAAAPKSSTLNSNDHSGYMTIGGGYVNWHYYGLIDDLSIYDRALNASEVSALYEGGNNSLNACELNIESDVIPEVSNKTLNILLVLILALLVGALFLRKE